MNEEIQEKWKIVEYEAKEGAKDFKVFCNSIKSVVMTLADDYQFFFNYINQPVAFEANNLIDILQRFYTSALDKAKLEILERLQRSGENYFNFDQFINNSRNNNERLTKLNNAKLLAWNKAKGRFLEALCFLSTIATLKKWGKKKQGINLFGQVGPIKIIDNNIEKYLWTQQNIYDTGSNLTARPDIIISQPDGSVKTNNIINIIECKCVKKIGATTLRSEFGKAHDLRVSSYTIISYYNIETNIVTSAKKLGLDLIPFRLHTKERDRYIKYPSQLVEALSEDIQKSRIENNFLNLLDTVVKEAKYKLKSA